MTPAVAPLVEATGQFANQRSRWAEGVIGPDRARELARQYAREFLPFHKSRLERERGGPIDLARIEPDPRVTLAESPAIDPGESAFRPLRKALGDYYLVTLMQDGVPAVRIAVSALSDDIGIVDGHLKAPAEYGNEFRSIGIAPDGVTGGLAAPEAVVAHVAGRTAALVDGEPRYVRRGPGFSPFMGAWVVRVDRPLTLRTDGVALESSQVFVSNTGELLTPGPATATGPILRIGPTPHRVQVRPHLSWTGGAMAIMDGGVR